MECLDCFPVRHRMGGASKSEPMRIELNEDNIKEYLSISFDVVDYDIKEEFYYLYGFPVYDYEGSYAKVRLTINPKASNYEFNDLSFSIVATILATEQNPWEFKNGNSVITQNNMKYNRSFIKCVVPYNGTYTKEIDLIIGYNPDSTSVLKTSSPNVYINEILNIQGSVVVN